MNSQQYIENAIKTESVPAYLEINQFALHATLIASIAAANVADLVKRKLFYGKDVPVADLIKQCDGLIQAASYLKSAAEHDADNINNVLPKATIDNESGVTLDLANLNIRLLHCVLGITSESGELAEAMLKQYETGVLDKVNFGEEVGDIDWYKAIGHHETGVSEEETRIKNIAKLQKRYPEKFTTEAALNRDLTGERAVLEAPLANAI
jgi:NTP pyrophosphatase (non-canonical NTP hydrolase)